MKIIEKQIIDHAWEEIYQMKEQEILIKMFEFRDQQSDLSEYIYSAMLDKQDEQQAIFSWRIILLMDQCFATTNGELGRISGRTIAKFLKNKDAENKVEMNFDMTRRMKDVGQKDLLNLILKQHDKYCNYFNICDEERKNFEMTILEICMMYRNEVNRMTTEVAPV